MTQICGYLWVSGTKLRLTLLILFEKRRHLAHLYLLFFLLIRIDLVHIGISRSQVVSPYLKRPFPEGKQAMFDAPAALLLDVCRMRIHDDGF